MNEKRRRMKIKLYNTKNASNESKTVYGHQQQIKSQWNAKNRKKPEKIHIGENKDFSSINQIQN